MSELEDILKSLANKDEDTEVVEKKNDLPDVSDDEEVMQEIVKMVSEDRQLANDFYNVFLPEVSKGTDRSQASKEAMAKAIELKISAARNIIDLLKVRKDNSSKNGVGIFFGNSMNERKAGINIQKLKDSIDD